MKYRIANSYGEGTEVKFRWRIILANWFIRRHDLLESRAHFWRRLADSIYESVNYQLSREEFIEDSLRELNTLIDNLEEDEEE